MKWWEPLLVLPRVTRNKMDWFNQWVKKVKNSSYTNRILLNGQKQYRFELIVNEIENFPYVLSIRLYDSDDKKESYTFDIAKLNEFISLIEATRENSNAMNSQNAIVREEVSKLRSMH